jgi:hypothetical protein
MPVSAHHHRPVDPRLNEGGSESTHPVSAGTKREIDKSHENEQSYGIGRQE